MKRKFKKGEEYIDTLLLGGPILLRIMRIRGNTIVFKSLRRKDSTTFLECFNKESEFSYRLIKATKLTKTIYELNDE